MRLSSILRVSSLLAVFIPAIAMQSPTAVIPGVLPRSGGVARPPVVDAATAQASRGASHTITASRPATNPTPPGKGDIITLAGGGPPNGISALQLAVGASSATAIDAQGNVYIAATWVNRIYKVATDGTVTLVADNTTGIIFPAALALDSTGNLYVADTSTSLIRKIDTLGNITTVAGNGTAGFAGDNGPATSAELNFPSGIAVDAPGNLYIGDSNNNRVRKVDTSGTITTIAGNGTGGFAGDNGPATSAELFSPFGLAIDSNGNLYIADVSNSRVRKVDASGTITSVAGFFLSPRGVAVDNAGNVYVADTNSNVIRKVTPSGTVTVVAGNGNQGFSGDGGPAANAQLFIPEGIAVDAAGNLYIADSLNSRTRRVDVSGVINTFAGNGTLGDTGDGGPATSGELNNPIGVLADASGNILVGDSLNSVVRKVTAGQISRLAGNGVLFGLSGAEFAEPTGVASDSSGNVFIADSSFNQVFKVDSSGKITTIAGTGTAGFSGDNGPATAAELSLPAGLAFDSKGNLYVSDGGNNRIRKIDTSGTITTVAAELNFPFGIAVDSAGNLYIAEIGDSLIRKVDASGTITTVAGTGIAGFSGDGGPATNALLNQPSGVAVDSGGNLYIADEFNDRVRKVDTSGMITTLAGNGTVGFAGDSGPAINAELAFPSGVSVDTAGNVYIADSQNNRIREVLSGIGFSSSTLSFGPTALGFSQSLPFQITNTGNTPLSITALAFSGANAGDFTQSNNCVGTLGAGLACTINVTFAPSKMSAEAGQLIINDNALSPVQIVLLGGSGVTPFTLASASQSLNISAPGGTASTKLTLAPGGGFNGTINLACTVAFVGTTTAVDLPTCSFSPMQLNINSSGTATTTLTVNTSAPSSSLSAPQHQGATGNGWSAGLVVAMLGLVLIGGVPRRNRRHVSALVLLAWMLVSAGCGSSNSVVTHHDPGTTLGNFNITVTATSGNSSASTVVTATVQ